MNTAASAAPEMPCKCNDSEEPDLSDLLVENETITRH
jgi:hypothetical protein